MRVEGMGENAWDRLDLCNLFFSLKTNLHPKHVEALTLNVLDAHVNDALDAKKGASSGHGDTVLARTRLGDETLLAKALCQKDLGCVGPET